MPFRPLPSTLQVGIANNSNYKEFLPVELIDLPEGIVCTSCLMYVSTTFKDGEHQLCQ